MNGILKGFLNSLLLLFLFVGTVYAESCFSKYGTKQYWQWWNAVSYVIENADIYFLNFVFDDNYTEDTAYTVTDNPKTMTINTTFADIAEIDLYCIDASGDTITTFALSGSDAGILGSGVFNLVNTEKIRVYADDVYDSDLMLKGEK